MRNNSVSRLSTLVAAIVAIAVLTPSAPASAQVAKDLFGRASTPAPLAARAIGSYAKGCLAGAAPLPVDGPAWQVMRLSRNRNWGHPNLVAVVERIASQGKSVGWNGLLVGDLAQPRGGPMTSGHASHQIGLDADIWLTPMPNRTLSSAERESISATSMLKGETRVVDPNKFTPAHAAIIKVAAKQPETARIFVHPAIKKALCDSAGSDRSWLSKVRPWWGHYYHFHVRIKCPSGSQGCSNQSAPPPGDGCGKELDWWLSDAPWKPSPTPPKPKPPLRMADLPGECRQVVDAGAGGIAATISPANTPTPRPRP